MDDDVDLPDETGKSGLISDLFGDTKRRPSRRTNLDDILGGGSTSSRRKPTVTFQEPSTSQATNSKSDTGPNLFSSLFPSTSDTSRRRPATSDQPASNRDITPPRDTQGRAGRSRDKEERSEPSRVSRSPESTRDVEVEQLRKEISTLRYEKNEDQQTISELRRKYDNAEEDHKRNVRDLEDKHVREIEDTKRKYEREIEASKIGQKQDEEIISQLHLESINNVLGELKNEIQIVNASHEDVDKVTKFANEQILNSLLKIKDEKENWENQKSSQITVIEQALENLYQKYTEEIIQGRRWIEQEKTKLLAEKLAFQEEQAEILQFLDQKREEMDEHKNDFIRKEHDLLVRVVNERNVLDQMKNEFILQRNSDIMRIREEAEHLERCLIQVENAYQGLEKARKDYEQKNLQLTEIKQALLEYEQSLWNRIPK